MGDSPGPGPSTPSLDEVSRKAILDEKIGSDYGALQTIYADFQRNFTNYVQTGGVSPQGNDESDPNYTAANSAWTQIRRLLAEYQELNNDLSTTLQSETDAGDVSNGLSNYEKKKLKLEKLQSQIEEQKTHLDIAKSRQQTIPRARLEQSYVQGIAGRLGFKRPLQPITIALLVGIAVFLFFLSFLILRDFFTIGAGVVTYESQTVLTELFASPVFRTIVFSASITLILFAIALYIYFYRLPAY